MRMFCGLHVIDSCFNQLRHSSYEPPIFIGEIEALRDELNETNHFALAEYCAEKRFPVLLNERLRRGEIHTNFSLRTDLRRAISTGSSIEELLSLAQRNCRPGRTGYKTSSFG